MATAAPRAATSGLPLFPKRPLGRIVLPVAGVFFFVMIWLPVLETFYLSLFHKEPGEFYFIGLTNYARMFGDELWRKSLSVTITFALMDVPAAVASGLVVALMLNTIKRTGVRAIFTASFFFAYVVPLVAVALVWRFMYLPGPTGLFNTLLGLVGVNPIPWLNSEEWALRSVVILRVWKQTGYLALLFLAGLQSIPAVLYEAAAVDGAAPWHRFRHVTIPLLMPTMAFVVIIATLGAFLTFTEIYVMTQAEGVGSTRGGPNYSTHVMAYYIYTQAISFQHEGFGSAAAVIFFLITVCIAYVQFRFLRARHEY
ncbi:MAG TPA: sugar ABC transporter permease [Chloroflexota bacterium]|nr:sugar ABC transporter permease [Chloroflexota bacterium]